MINQGQLVVFILILTRVSVFIAVFPIFSRRQLPNLVKVGLSAALTLFWFAEAEAHTASAVEDATSWAAILLIAKEVLTGIVLGTAMAAFFYPAKVAGAYVGQELGLSLASISDPGSQDSSTLVTRLFETFTILLFFSINLHHFLILALHYSFEQLSAGLSIGELPTEQLVTLLTRVCDYGLLVAAPLMILFMLVSLILAFLNRAAPSLNLFSVGMSIRAGLGIFCLFLFSPVIFGAMESYLYRVQQDVENLIGALL
ncbi:MAG: flagellar biosynthetic protein FliR [Planctomycetota bacterium]